MELMGAVHPNPCIVVWIICYKASFGRVPFVSRPNAFGAGNIFLFEGTLTRNVEDAAIGLNALSGYHPRDPFSLDTDYDFSRALGRSIKGWKIAYSPNFDVFPVDQEVKNVITNSAKAFEDMGAHVEKVDLGINRSQQELSDSKLPVECKLSERDTQMKMYLQQVPHLRE